MTLTSEAVERGARALEEAINGGSWNADYTDQQRALWRARVLVAVAAKHDAQLPKDTAPP